MGRFELDHLFVLSAKGAPESEALLARGFREGSPNVHTGQGTACRRFFFDNAMLEFLYVTEFDTLAEGSAARTGLAPRWTALQSSRVPHELASSASPFGVCIRSAEGLQIEAPFPSWTYGPAYLPNGQPAYQMSARCAQITQPFVFYMPQFSAPVFYPPERRQPLDHPCGARKLTCLRIETPQAAVPDLESAGLGSQLEIQTGAARHRMALVLDGGRRGESLELPTLSLSW